MTWDPAVPHDTLMALPPSCEVETKPILKAVVEARAAVARLDARTMSLPNPDVLLSPLVLLEAQASAQIENIVTTADELFSAASTDKSASPAAREALQYRAALWKGIALARARPLSVPAIVEICSAVLGHQMTIRPSEGVYIGDPRTRTRAYTPPRASGAHLDRLIEFIHDPGGLDPLVATALAHYQFEAIHPFTDGNGRTGRVLNAVLIDHYGLLAWPVAYLSRYFIKTKAEYYSGLEGVTARGDWHGWVQYFLDGVLASARNSLRLIDEIEDVQASLADVARHRLGRLDAALVPALVANPYVRAAQVAEVCGVTRQTASTWLGTLSADNGPLTAHRMGRNTVYANQALMETLTRPADSSA